MHHVRQVVLIHALHNFQDKAFLVKIPNVPTAFAVAYKEFVSLPADKAAQQMENPIIQNVKMDISVKKLLQIFKVSPPTSARNQVETDVEL